VSKKDNIFKGMLLEFQSYLLALGAKNCFLIPRIPINFEVQELFPSFFCGSNWTNVFLATMSILKYLKL
jgi:hypothetical protein